MRLQATARLSRPGASFAGASHLHDVARGRSKIGVVNGRTPKVPHCREGPHDNKNEPAYLRKQGEDARRE
jgi:hypothetical protein